MIFVDTSYFHALFEAQDENHSRALDAAREFRGRHLPDLLITTDLVVMETITLARRRGTHRQAVFVGDHLFNEKSAVSIAQALKSSERPLRSSGNATTRNTARRTV